MAAKGNARSMTGISDPSDKLSSNTLKRHPKMDLNKADMLQLLSYLEGELQARDIAIAALQAEKAKQFLYQAKYGRFGLVDPLHALQRDSELANDNSFDEAAVKAMYDDQLMQLENLIATQHKSQQQMREQLAAVEKRYHKTCAELDEEKAKHARDMEQGDNVTYMLEKDRERLKQELEFEKSQAKKFEKELKKTSNNLDEDRTVSVKHKQVAVMLIKERTALVKKLVSVGEHCASLEAALDELRSANHVEETPIDPRKSAEYERRLHEFDFEREQLRARVAKAEAQNAELCAELERLQLSGAGSSWASGGMTSVGSSLVEGGLTTTTTTGERRRVTDAGAHSSVAPARHPHVYISERTVSPTPVTTTITHSKMLQQSSQLKLYTTGTPPEIRKPTGATNTPPPPPVRKTSPDTESGGISPRTGLSGGSVTTAIRRAGPVQLEALPLTRPSTADQRPGAMTLSADPGARVSVGGAAPPRKLSPMGRGVPPPIPPNKPQVFMPAVSPTSRVVGPSHEVTRVTAVGVSKLQSPSSSSPRVGSVMEGDRTSSVPSSAVRSLPAAVAPGHASSSLLSLGESSSSTTGVRKPATQVCINIK